jgi:hypothetical protein
MFVENHPVQNFGVCKYSLDILLRNFKFTHLCELISIAIVTRFQEQYKVCFCSINMAATLGRILKISVCDFGPHTLVRATLPAPKPTCLYIVVAVVLPKKM